MVVATTILLQLFSKPLLCFYSFRGQFSLTFFGDGGKIQMHKKLWLLVRWLGGFLYFISTSTIPLQDTLSKRAPFLSAFVLSRPKTK